MCIGQIDGTWDVAVIVLDGKCIGVTSLGDWRGDIHSAGDYDGDGKGMDFRCVSSSYYRAIRWQSP